MSDTYVYPGTKVLINLSDIRCQKKLDDYENTFVNLSLLKILKDEFVITSSNDVYWLHKQLFQEVYEWAGSPRTLNIYKEEIVLNGQSVEYSNFAEIPDDQKMLDSVIKQTKWESLSKPKLIIDISSMILKLWRIHPFREGNTRTITTFLFFFLKNNGFSLNVELLMKNVKFFRNALVMSSIKEYSECEHLQNILNDAIENFGEHSMRSSKIMDDSKYKTIKGHDMEEYTYNYHTVKE